ncbi:hypothetical protein NP493_90g01013 [Ridgeia piscesae]|uniref:Uncharacterized protein n=1 Tax=Ridgeia piscesae TaxID=27915 RepID=A0AAD9P8F3_RIDPI|nr:hypothetical protein NP493_90g01013 [Ridgeia piscesae]
MSLQYTQKEIDEMKTTIRSQGDRLTNTTKDVERVTCAQSEMEDGMDYVENQICRNNLRIDGVAEVAAETWADTEAIVRKTFAAGMHLPEDQANTIRVERAHRTGASNSSGRPKTVVVTFESYEDRDTILQTARKQKSCGIFANEDLSHRVNERRKELMPKLREARENGKMAYLVYDRLVVKESSLWTNRDFLPEQSTGNNSHPIHNNNMYIDYGSSMDHDFE